MFWRNKSNIDIPDQSFVKDVDLDVSVSHPLRTRKIVRVIAFFFLAAFFISGGAIGIKRPYENASQQSANIASSTLFFVVGILFLLIAYFIIRTPVIIKEVKSSTIGVWVGVRKNIVFLDAKQVYKGKNKVIRVNDGNKVIYVNVAGKTVYFE